MGRALIVTTRVRFAASFAYAAFLREETVWVPCFFRDRAALFACRESALCDAAERGSRLSAARRLRDRLEEDAEVAFFLRL